MLARRATIRKPRNRNAKRTGAQAPRSLGTSGNSLKLTPVRHGESRAVTPTSTRVSFNCNTETCSIGNSTIVPFPGTGPARPTTLTPNKTDTSAIPPSLSKPSLSNSNGANRTSLATSGSPNPQRTSLYEAYAILKVSTFPSFNAASHRRETSPELLFLLQDMTCIQCIQLHEHGKVMNLVCDQTNSNAEAHTDLVCGVSDIEHLILNFRSRGGTCRQNAP